VVEREQRGDGVDRFADDGQPPPVRPGGRPRREREHGGGDVQEQAAQAQVREQAGQPAVPAADVEDGAGAELCQARRNIGVHVILRQIARGEEPAGIGVVVPRHSGGRLGHLPR
jgi:hypothetical protein